MSFYFVILSMHLIVTAILIWLLFRWASRKFRHGKRINYLSYIAPVILACVCIIYFLTYTTPFILDLFRMVNRTYEVGTYEVVHVHGPWIELSNGQTMLYNPFGPPILSGQQYQLTYLPRSTFVQSFILLR